MAFLDTYTTPLTSSDSAHLLRRATFGPTQEEIAGYVGKTALQAVDILINNVSYRSNPEPPIELDESRSDVGEPFFTKPFVESRSSIYTGYVQLWWIGLMTEQNGRPSLLEKLTAFWQNHFVVTYSPVDDHRFTYNYLRFLRGIALGNFRDMTIGISKDPAMLLFQNGNENEKKRPNENYGRELQELFTVGQKDFAGNHNYTEQDVKAAAQVLTGWQVTNRRAPGSTTFGVTFNPDRHDTTDKLFSEHYNNAVIQGQSGTTSGDSELLSLVNLLLQHPETPKFICRKLYRWYINDNVTEEIEEQVIKPLATFFASTANNYEIKPVIKKLLTSNIFFDPRNRGSIIKSPAEFMIGTCRIFDIPVPEGETEIQSFRNLTNFLSTSMKALQLNFLNQPSVFGSLPYYQTGYSKNWINGTTLGLRGARMDSFVYPNVMLKPGKTLGIDLLGILKSIQPDFSNVEGSPAITCEDVLARLSKNLFATELTQTQKDFLIDSIMMMNSSPRTTWTKEWNAYRTAPNDSSRQNTILWRCRALLKHMLRMAEYQVF